MGLLDSLGSFAYTRSRVASLRQEILQEVSPSSSSLPPDSSSIALQMERLGGNQILSELMKSLQSDSVDEKEPVPEAP